MSLSSVSVLLFAALMAVTPTRAVRADQPGSVQNHAKSKMAQDEELKSIVLIQDQIQKKGFDKVLKKAKWPIHIPKNGTQDDTQSGPDSPISDCVWLPDTPGCPGTGGMGGDTYPGSYPGGYDNGIDYGTTANVQKAMQLKDDGVQILATYTLMKTLDFFKVKFAFGKVKAQNPNTYGSSNSTQYTYAFKVLEPRLGEDFQDLDTEQVLGAIRQFRKYIIGLLCGEPSPSRVLAMMNKYDVGTRFRWDMAWALLGNELPDAPNKFMRFGARWRKFSLAMDGIEQGSLIRLRNPNGSITPIDTGAIVGQAGGAAASGAVKVGFIAREVVGIIRLAGDIVAQILNLFCLSDLSVDAKKELQKQQVVTKLLNVKKELYTRLSPVVPILQEMGKQATQVTKQPQSFMPPGMDNWQAPATPK